MTQYLLPLLAVAVLCGAWGVFHLWLARRDPELAERANKCGNCSCDRQSGTCSNAR
jgi:hypothetical protein